MPPGNSASRPQPPPPLTLKALLGAIAASALAFATLPLILSVPSVAALLGVLALQGMRLPVITERRGARRWLPWVAWSVLLAACPVAMVAVAELYPYTGPPAFNGLRPWAARVVDGLVIAHLAASVAAAMAVVVLSRGGVRWLAWAMIVVVGLLAGLVALGAVMTTTGVYL